MIVAIALLLAAVAPTHPALRGIDDVPQLSGTEFTAAALWEIVADESTEVVIRARAARLLPVTLQPQERVAASSKLSALLLSTSTAALAYDLALARFEIAAHTSVAAAVGVADASERSKLPMVRQAAAVMWWRLGGEAGRVALQRCVAREAPGNVRATCIGRLRAPVSRPATGAVPDVLHETSDGDSPTSPGRQLRRAADLPEQR